MKSYIAEAIGTFVLVFFGVGAAVLANSAVGVDAPFNYTGVSLAFGISVVCMAYSIGQISGAHLNPAVSLGAMVAGRISPVTFVGYSVSQIAGGLIAGFVLFTIASGSANYDVSVGGLGQNGWGEGYGGEFNMAAAFIFEAVATAVFLIVILGVTQDETGNPAFAGLVIGLTLTMIHLVGITVTGTSVNPARSIASAVFAGPGALSQLWLFIAAPLVGAAIGGILHKAKITSP